MWEGTISELYAALDSEYKPDRDKDFGKQIRAIAKRSPILIFEELQRTNSRRPIRLMLKAVDTVDTVDTIVTRSPEEDKIVEGAL